MLSNKFAELQTDDIIIGVDGPVNRGAIIRYAESSGDRNPIHTTYSVAMAAGLKGVIQHGLFSLGWLIKTLTNWIGENGKLKHLNIQFRAMVRPNDLVYNKCTVIQKSEENGQKIVEFKLIQEAWSLLCKGSAQANNKSITSEMFKSLLSSVRFGINTQLKIEDAKIESMSPPTLEFQAAGIAIIPGTLSFGEALIRGWARNGETIDVRLTSPLENGMAEFEIHRVSKSIQGTATILLRS